MGNWLRRVYGSWEFMFKNKKDIIVCDAHEFP